MKNGLRAGYTLLLTRINTGREKSTSGQTDRPGNKYLRNTDEEKKNPKRTKTRAINNVTRHETGDGRASSEISRRLPRIYFIVRGNIAEIVWRLGTPKKLVGGGRYESDWTKSAVRQSRFQIRPRPPSRPSSMFYEIDGDRALTHFENRSFRKKKINK